MDLASLFSPARFIPAPAPSASHSTFAAAAPSATSNADSAALPHAAEPAGSDFSSPALEVMASANSASLGSAQTLSSQLQTSKNQVCRGCYSSLS
jgi:hypothetical protein